MKSLWIFLLGAAINLGFIIVFLISHWKSEYSNEPGMTKPVLPIYAVVIGIFLLAGVLARYFDYPGLANILVMIVPGLAFVIAFLFVIIFIRPKGIGPGQLLGILLAILAFSVGIYFQFGRYKKIFDISKMQAERQQGKQVEQYGRKVLFSNEGRSGHLTYNGAEGRFSLYFEFGGNDVVAIITVPNQEQWFEKTGIGLGERERILNEIGAEAVASQTRNGRYKLEGDAILVYNR